MGWLSQVTYAIGTAIFYLASPVTFVARWTIRLLHVILSPLIHLGNHLLSVMLLPLRFVAKLETVYIYLGIAVIIGLATSTILQISSAVLFSVFNLDHAPEEAHRNVRSTRARYKQSGFENAWDDASKKRDSRNRASDDSVEKKYAEWIEKDDRSLLGQTIIEEDDDSD